MMTSDDERGRDAEPAGEVREPAEAGRRRPPARWVSEAVVAAIPKEGQAVAAEPAEGRQRPRTRVVAEAIVAAIPGGGGAAEGGAGGEARAEP